MANIEAYKLNTINNTFEKFAILGDWKYYRISKKKNDVNTFELKLNIYEVANGINVDFWNMLVEDNFNFRDNIYLIKSDFGIGFITTYKTDNSTNVNNVTFSFNGLDVQALLKWRIVSPYSKVSATGNYKVNGPLQTVITELIYDAFKNEEIATTGISGGVDARRKVDFIENVIFDITNNPTIKNEFRLKSGEEIIKEIFESAKVEGYEYSIECVLNDNGKIDFVVTEAEDVSDEVEFSTISRRNLNSSSLQLNLNNEFNTMVVAGENESNEREFVYFPSENKSGIFMKELYINASDIQKEDAEPQIDYIERLNARAKTKAEETKANETFSFKIGELNENKYGIDFKVGDKIKIIDEYEIKENKMGEIILDIKNEFIVTIAVVNISAENSKNAAANASVYDQYTFDLELGNEILIESTTNKIQRQNYESEVKR